MALTFYTVLCDKKGFPVKYCAPENDYRVQRFAGSFDDPGEASQEFQISRTDEMCYLDEKAFAAKANALAVLRKQNKKSK